jgi:hypothetical protein
MVTEDTIKKELWDREIENFQNKIKQKSTETVGELDHPEFPSN